MILEEDKKLLSVWLLYYLKTFSFYIFFFYIPIRQWIGDAKIKSFFIEMIKKKILWL